MSLSKAATLVIEDDTVLSAMFARYLGIYYEVTGVTSIAGARDALSRREYDVVLLDKKLPDGSGLELISEIRGQHRNTAIIVLTADGDFRSIAEALESGADDYVVKSGDLVPHLLVRFPVAISHAKERAKFEASHKANAVALPDNFTGESYHEFLEACEERFLNSALDKFDRNVSLTAGRLGLARSTLFRKLSQFKVAPFSQIRKVQA